MGGQTARFLIQAVIWSEVAIFLTILVFDKFFRRNYDAYHRAEKRRVNEKKKNNPFNASARSQIGASRK